MKMSRISVRFLWIAGTRMCDGRSCPSWTIISARSVSQTSMPSWRSASLSSISCVAIDLTLTTSVAPCVPDDRGDDRVRLGGVARPVDGPAGRGDRRLELDEERRQVAHDLVLDRGAGEPQLLPVGALGDGRGALGPDRGGRPAEVGPELLVGQRGAGGLRERRGAAEGRSGVGLVMRGPRSTPGSRRGA